jgi:7-keto-8-aminopelargonate synthetase-like enzyme
MKQTKLAAVQGNCYRSVFSMDGELQIDEICDLARNICTCNDDESHSSGFMEKRRGVTTIWVMDKLILFTTTFGKHLEEHWWMYSGRKEIIDWMRNKARHIVSIHWLGCSRCNNKSLEILMLLLNFGISLKRTQEIRKAMTEADLTFFRNTSISPIMSANIRKLFAIGIRFCKSYVEEVFRL